MLKRIISDTPACREDILAISDALDILGGKWTILVLCYLLYRDKELNTFNKIEKDIVGISARILSKELKTLEANRLIKREVMNTKPIMVRYSVTSYGKQVEKLVFALINWGKQHRKKLFGK